MAVAKDYSKDITQDISFPLTKSSLWDSKPIGPSININLLPKNNLFVHISEKLLNILRFSLSQSNRSELIVDFITSLEFSQDDNIIFAIERFHHIKNNENLNFKENLEFYAHGKIYNNGYSSIKGDEDYSIHIEEIERKISSEKLLFNFFNFLSVNIAINILSNELENNIFNIYIGTTFVSNTFLVVPVKPLPFLSTALSNYLLSLNQSKQSININKHGFLSMDQTRKLLLLLESDPKALSLPLVGVWTCAVDNVNHALVAANLLRYVFNPALKNKICQSMKSFLLVLFPATFGGVEFYQCSVNSKDRQYNLISANESISFDRFNTNLNEVIEIELKLAADATCNQSNQKLQKSKIEYNQEIFDQNILKNQVFSVSNNASNNPVNTHISKINSDNVDNFNTKYDRPDKKKLSAHNSNDNLATNKCGEKDFEIDINHDMTPRSLPANCIGMQKSNQFQDLSSVPDVSLLSDYNVGDISKCNLNDNSKCNFNNNDKHNVSDLRPQSSISNKSNSKLGKSVILTLKSSTQSLNNSNNNNSIKNVYLTDTRLNMADDDFLSSKQDEFFDTNYISKNEISPNNITPNTRIKEHAKALENKTDKIVQIKNINVEEMSLETKKNKYLRQELNTISPINTVKSYSVDNKSTPINSNQTGDNPTHSTPIYLASILNMNEIDTKENAGSDNKQSKIVSNDTAQNCNNNDLNMNHGNSLNNMSDTSCENSLKNTLSTLVPQSVPLELYNLLLEQSKELKELRREINMLREEKNKEGNSKMNTKDIILNSIGTNTSLFLLDSNLPNNANDNNYEDKKFVKVSNHQSLKDNGVRVIDIIGPTLLNQMQNNSVEINHNKNSESSSEFQNSKVNYLISKTNHQKYNSHELKLKAFNDDNYKDNDNDYENYDDDLNVNESFHIEIPNNDQEMSVFPKHFEIPEYHSIDSCNDSISNNSSSEQKQMNQNKGIAYNELLIRVQDLLSQGNKLTEEVQLYPNNQEYHYDCHKSKNVREYDVQNSDNHIQDNQQFSTKNERILNFNSKSNNCQKFVSANTPNSNIKYEIGLKNGVYINDYSNRNQFYSNGNNYSKNKEKTNDNRNDSQKIQTRINNSKKNEFINNYSNSSEDKNMPQRTTSSKPKQHVDNRPIKRNADKDYASNNLIDKNEHNNNFNNLDSCSDSSDENSSFNSVNADGSNNSGSSEFSNNCDGINKVGNDRGNCKNYSHSNRENGKPLFDVNDHLRKIGVDINYNEKRQMYGETSILLPRLSYPSFLNHQSGSEISQHVDALALKYLTEEQIESLTKLQKYHYKQKQEIYNIQVEGPKTRKSDISRYGLPLEKMSFYSRDYLEKYGLLSNPNSPVKITKTSTAKSKVDAKSKKKKVPTATLR